MHSWRSSSFKLKFCSAYQDDLWFAPFLLSLKSPHTTKSVGSFRSPSFFFCSSCTSYMVEKTVSEISGAGRGGLHRPGWEHATPSVGDPSIPSPLHTAPAPTRLTMTMQNNLPLKAGNRPAPPLRHFYHNGFGPLAGRDGREQPESMENYSICPSGSEIKKVDPSPSTDSNQMRPPCRSTSSRQRYNPKPVPPMPWARALSARAKRPKT